MNDGRFAAMLAARATCYGAMVGVDYGEPFYVNGPLLVRRSASLEEGGRGAPSIPVLPLAIRPGGTRLCLVTM